MYLRRNLNRKSGRTQLAIVHGYRDSQGKARQKTVLKIGYLDVVAQEYEDPIAHLPQASFAWPTLCNEQSDPQHPGYLPDTQ